MFVSYVYTFSLWSLTSSCEIVYSRIFINYCKKRYLFFYLPFIQSYMCLWMHFKLNALLFRGMKVASATDSSCGCILSWDLPKSKDAPPHSLFPPFFLCVRVHILCIRSILKTNACVPDLLSTILCESLHPIFFLVFFPIFSLLNFKV